MIGIDTNVLLRWLLGSSVLPEDAPDQAEALERLKQMADETFFINHVVLAEAIWVLRRGAKLSRKETVSILERLLMTGNVEFQAPEIVEAAVKHLSALPGDFADHLIGEINKQHGCITTFTFDKIASKSPNFSDLTR